MDTGEHYIVGGSSLLCSTVVALLDIASLERQAFLD